MPIGTSCAVAPARSAAVALRRCVSSSSAWAHWIAGITHEFPGDLRVALTSPHGTKFIVSDPATGDPHTQLDNQIIPAFGGEPAAGSWRLDVVDQDPTDTGRVNSWSLAIAATCPPRAQ